jgi:hypothetical protein
MTWPVYDCLQSVVEKRLGVLERFISGCEFALKLRVFDGS